MASLPIPVEFNRCNQCRFWAARLSDFENVAECRRLPPARSETFIAVKFIGIGMGRSVSATVRGKGLWPLTDGEDGCGKFDARG